MQLRGLGTEIFPHGVRTLSGEQRTKTNKRHPQGHLGVTDTQESHDVLHNTLEFDSLISFSFVDL